MQSVPHDSPGTLVFCWQNSNWVSPNWGATTNACGIC